MLQFPMERLKDKSHNYWHVPWSLTLEKSGFFFATDGLVSVYSFSCALNKLFLNLEMKYFICTI